MESMGQNISINSYKLYISTLLVGLFLLLIPKEQLQAQIVCTENTLSDVTLNFGGSDGILTFPVINGNDIANGGSPVAGPFDFDLFDNVGLGQDGITDLTISMVILPTFDPYGGLVLETASTTHQIQQSNTGLQGTMAHGTSGATNGTTGDVRCYQITVVLATGISVAAADFNVLLNSVNTAGEAFESTAIVFLDETGVAYGTASYAGFYSGPPTGVPGGANPPIVAATAWTSSGTGVYIADATTIDLSDPFNPAGANNGPLDNNDPNASDTGLMPTDLVSGCIYTVCLEDVAATAADGDITSSNTSFTSTIQGLSLTNICFGDWIPLSAELTDFAVEKEGCRARLSWITESETDMDRFEVERSADGIDFQSIAQVAANNGSTSVLQYSFTDRNPLESNYYRLAMVELDGTVDYSGVLSFKSGCKAGFYLENIYPNPVKEELTVAFQSDKDRLWSVVLTDVLGRDLLFTKAALLQGHNQLTVDVRSLSAGVYFLRMLSDGRQVVRRVVVSG